MTLGVSHLPVNRRISMLERSIGAHPVSRNKSGAVVTSAGRRLLSVAEEAYHLFKHARRDLEGMDKRAVGDVRFSAFGPLAHCLVAPILAEFSAACPKANLILSVSNSFDYPQLLESKHQPAYDL